MSSTNSESTGSPLREPTVSLPQRETAAATFVQLLRFLVVGGLNTVFGYSLFAAFTYFGMPYPAAIGLATVGGVLFNFQSIGRLVFNGAPRSRFWRFVGVYIVIYLLNLLANRNTKVSSMTLNFFHYTISFCIWKYNFP